MNGKKWLVILLAVVLVAAAVFLSRYFVKPVIAPTVTGGNQQQSAADGEKMPPDELWGKLSVSDNMEKGNLMLEMDSGRTVYLNTTRDFSGLVGKQVRVKISGDQTSFSLLDIKEK